MSSRDDGVKCWIWRFGVARASSDKQVSAEASISHFSGRSAVGRSASSDMDWKISFKGPCDCQYRWNGLQVATSATSQANQKEAANTRGRRVIITVMGNQMVVELPQEIIMPVWLTSSGD